MEDKLGPLDHFFITVNGKKYKVGSDFSPWTSLLQFLRENLSLKGAKGFCHHGGCGVCTVVISHYDYETETTKTFSVPSCRVLLYSCVGVSVNTIEGLGSRRSGPHDLQKALAGFGGTQCGFCSPGMIMTAHGKGLTSGSLSMSDVEKTFDGNLCRCTGYRPILDAFKSFASDATQQLKGKLSDIEELYDGKCGKSCGSPSDGTVEDKCFGCKSPPPNVVIRIQHPEAVWHRPTNLTEVFAVMNKVGPKEKMRLVAGNSTSIDYHCTILISTSGVRELFKVEVSEHLCSIGANITIGRCIEIFSDLSERNTEYAHLNEVAEHWKKVANNGTRNIATWAGNLALKHTFPSFNSDLWITLLACDAKVRIRNSDCNEKELLVDFEEFLGVDMSKSLILSLEIPSKKNFKLRTFKVMPRAANCSGYLVAAFGFYLDDQPLRPNIIIGGLHGTNSARATMTEKRLSVIRLSDKDAILSAIHQFPQEMKAEKLNHLDSSPEYKLNLSQALLYKAFLGVMSGKCQPRVIRGGEDLKRPVSSGRQSFDNNEDTWPVGQAIPKVETTVQVTGEAEFTDDLPPAPGELFGVFVKSACARAKIKCIDASECLKQPGVVDFVTAKDIPGVNSFINEGQLNPIPHPDPIFVEGQVIYGGQPIGLIVAETKHAAIKAIPCVKVTYEDIQKPIVDVKEAIALGRAEPAMNFFTFKREPMIVGDTEAAFSSSSHMIEGELMQGSQFHFALEPLSARVSPTDEGIDVSCTTQWPTETQKAIAACLNIHNNSINLSVKRLGGGFGSKGTRANVVNCAAAVAAYKLQRAVRVTLDLKTHMSVAGCREPYYTKYKVGFTDEGKLTSMDLKVFADVGHTDNEASSPFSFKCLQNVYHCPNWKISYNDVFTDSAANTFCRAPGYIQALAVVENIMEQIAFKLKKEPLDIRKINFANEKQLPVLSPFIDKNLVESSVVPILEERSDFEKRRREIEQFNKENRWLKRGISLVPSFYPIFFFPIIRYNVQVVIYENDGTVAIAHGGIEMGQGINTKVIQAAAKVLEIPVDLICVKPTNVFTGANSGPTEASIASDLNMHGVILCCKEIKGRMEPVVAKLKEENGGEQPSWQDVVRRCRAENVDICQRQMALPKDFPKDYDVWAGACVEVLLDVLTGQHLVLRVDIIEDCGRSLNPMVDVGQVEGAFVMGLGYFTTERIVFDPSTGLKASIGSELYHPPTALDIPVDFRVSFLPGGDNPYGVLRSKATGEPPICMSYGVVTTLRHAITSARTDAGNDDWFEMDIPVRPDDVHRLCLVNSNDFSF